MLEQFETSPPGKEGGVAKSATEKWERPRARENRSAYFSPPRSTVVVAAGIVVALLVWLAYALGWLP